MAPAHPRWASLLLLPLLGVATGARAEAQPWPDALLLPPQLPPAVVAPSSAPGIPRPERPTVVPKEVSVGDLALGEQPAGAGSTEGGPPQPLHYPLAVAASEQDPWGWRYSTARGAWRMHTGLDLIAPEGTEVLAVQGGRVQRVAEIDGYGLTVLIDHGSGWSSLYAHLLQASVEPGEQVGPGQALGLVGQSGNASTAHLHLELRQRQPRGLVAVDPTPLLPGPQDSDLRNRPDRRTASTAAAMP